MIHHVQVLRRLHQVLAMQCFYPQVWIDCCFEVSTYPYISFLILGNHYWSCPLTLVHRLQFPVLHLVLYGLSNLTLQHKSDCLFWQNCSFNSTSALRSLSTSSPLSPLEIHSSMSLSVVCVLRDHQPPPS